MFKMVDFIESLSQIKQVIEERPELLDRKSRLDYLKVGKPNNYWYNPETFRKLKSFIIKQVVKPVLTDLGWTTERFKKEADVSGLRIIGPNCVGIVSSQSKLNASFANQMPLPGKMAFISQSGAICTAWA